MNLQRLMSWYSPAMTEPTSRLVSASPVDKIAQTLGGEPPPADPEIPPRIQFILRPASPKTSDDPAASGHTPAGASPGAKDQPSRRAR